MARARPFHPSRCATVASPESFYMQTPAKLHHHCTLMPCGTPRSPTGLDDVHGTLKAVLADAPPEAACPECRQKGAFEGALLMKKLAATINHRLERWREKP